MSVSASSRAMWACIAGAGVSGTGGVGAAARAQAHALSHKYAVAAVVEEGADFPADVVLGVRRARVDWLRRFSHVPREWVAARRAARALVAFAREHPLAIAFLHSQTLASQAVGKLRTLGVATVLVVHADVRDRPRGTYDSRVTAFYRRSAQLAYRRVDLVLVGSEHIARLVRSDAKVHGPVTVLPSPVAGFPMCDTEFREARSDRGRVRIGYFGRLSIEKGPEVLASAFGLLRREGLEVELQWVGDGPLRTQLEKLFAAPAFRGRVSFLGWQNRCQLAELYRDVDIVCVPSISEPQGLVALEALSCGVPVVASRVGGLADLVRPGVDGELAQPGDAMDLASALRRAIECRAARGYQVPDPRWLQRYTPAAYADGLYAAIETILPGSSAH